MVAEEEEEKEDEKTKFRYFCVYAVGRKNISLLILPSSQESGKDPGFGTNFFPGIFFSIQSFWNASCMCKRLTRKYSHKLLQWVSFLFFLKHQCPAPTRDDLPDPTASPGSLLPSSGIQGLCFLLYPKLHRGECSGAYSILLGHLVGWLVG